jgi:hypothetical protein
MIWWTMKPGDRVQIVGTQVRFVELFSSVVDPHLVSGRIRIKLFISVRGQIQGSKPMRIRILVRL